MPSTNSCVVVLTLLTLVLIPSRVLSQQDDSVSWSVTPYIWGSDTTLDLTVQDSGINGGVEVPFNDLLDVLDTAFQIHVEGGKGNWSGFVDLIYLETFDTIDRPLLNIDTNSDQLFVDAALVFWPEGLGSQLSFFGGLRYVGMDDQFDFQLNSDPLVARSSGDDFFDLMLGARYRFDLSERWNLLTRVDVSFGDTEGSWLVNALFGYSVGRTRQNRILFGYQHKQFELQDRGLNSDYTLSGPMAGFNFRF
ncbi:MAG: hypothetical protein JJ921_02180 [Pseudomonadales bacterium]|nr:hypothetical protein [Pseudomonadales bacterium]MBO7005035.1 hypothetical protein [Pseudomonadales bacterium]